jgi:hypothetical protein
MKINKLKITLAVIAVTISGNSLANASGQANPRAMAMGDAYTALAFGLEAPAYNPANLGLSANRAFTMDFVSFGFDLKNNSFSLDDYNTYTGQFLGDDDKEAILDKIPGEGLRLDFAAEARGMNFSVWRLAFNLRGIGESKVKLDKDPFELLLYGNAVKPNVSLSDSRGEAQALGDGSVSYGQPIKTWQDGQLAVGATYHYLYGIAYEKIIEAEGGISTTDTGYVGDGSMTVRQALGGSGQAVDIGAAIVFAKNWTVSTSVRNIYSKVKWNKDTEETRFEFQMDPVTFQAMSDDDVNDSLVDNSDTTYDIAAFSTTLPTVFRFGLAKSSKHMTWAFDWTQATSSIGSYSTNPRVSTGLEYRPIGVFPLRLGVSTGGDRGTMFSAGLGIYMGPLHFDLATANYGTFIPNSTKGATLAFAMGLRF